MRILIVDDSIYKITALSKVILSEIPNAKIITADSLDKGFKIVEEQERFNLAIVDLKLPLNPNTECTEDGGKKFVLELYRKSNKIKIPNYIVGFTQYDLPDSSFSPIWRVISYIPNNNSWELSIKNILKHITNTGYEHIIPINKHHLFVEGLTDKNYLEKAFEIFSPDTLSKLQIEHSCGSGSNGLASNLCIWAMNFNYEYKAFGLFDSDDAANKAIQKIKDRNLSENENKCIFYHQLKPNYNEEVLNFYKKGCKIEIEIEQLFPSYILKIADENDFLEYRNVSFIETPSGWNQHIHNSREFLESIGFNSEQQLYLKKVKFFNKEHFSKLVLSQVDLERVFSNFKPIVQLIEEKLLN